MGVPSRLCSYLGYFGACGTYTRRTLGMRALGLSIADAADGRRLSYRQGAIRWAVINLETLAAIAVGLAISVGLASAVLFWAWMLVLLGTTAYSPTNQGLHDRAAGSVVTEGLAASEGGTLPPCAGPMTPGRRRGARRRRPRGQPRA